MGTIDPGWAALVEKVGRELSEELGGTFVPTAELKRLRAIESRARALAEMPPAESEALAPGRRAIIETARRILGESS